MLNIEFKGHEISQVNGLMYINNVCAGVRSLGDAYRIINGLKPISIHYDYKWDDEKKSVVKR